jgi:asparagine synthetase B (glutamine-hydrolysing)
VSGFVAIVRHDGRPVDPDEIDRLATTYELVRETSERSQLSCPYGEVVRFVSAVDSGEQVVRDGASWATAIGTVFPPGARLLTAGAEELDGQFALIRYDDTSQLLTVAVDPFGFQGVYVAERNGATYLSTSAIVLARHLSAGPDRLGQLMFLRTGWQAGAVTAWEGVARLDPALVLRFNPERREQETSFRPLVDPDVARLGFDAAVNRAIESLTDTYRRYYSDGGELWTDLTGGFDTRFMNLLLARAGVRFMTNTVGREEDEDVPVAREVAERAGWQWTQLTIPPRWPELLPKLLPLSVAWSDCRLEALQLAEVLWIHAEKAPASRTLLLGGGHEHFRGHTWQQEFLNAGKSNRVNLDNLLSMRWLARQVPTELFPSDPTPEIRSELERLAHEWLEPYREELNTVQLDVLHARRMIGHFGAFANAGGAFLDVQVPAYFKPVFQLAFSIDPKHRSSHRLMRAMIDKLDPAVAAVPTTAGGPAQPLRLSNIKQFAPYYGAIARKAVSKTILKRTGRSMLVRPPAPNPDAVAARRAVVEAVALSQDELRTRSLFAERPLEGFLRDAEDGTAHPAVLARLITLELSLRLADPAEPVSAATAARDPFDELVGAG